MPFHCHAKIYPYKSPLFFFLRGPLLNYETFLFECFSCRFNVQFSPIYFLIVAVFDCCTAADDDYDNREFPSFSMCYPQFRKLNRNWNISFLILDCSVHWLEYLVSSLTKIPPHSARLCVVGLQTVYCGCGLQRTLVPSIYWMGLPSISQGRGRETKSVLNRLFLNIGPPQLFLHP